MNRSVVREFQAPGLTAQPGEVLVPTEVGDPVRGLLHCPAAPLVAGSLRRKGRPVRLAAVPRSQDPQDDDDGAVLFAVKCRQHQGPVTVLAAAASPADRLAVAAARSAVEEWTAALGTRRLLTGAAPWCDGANRALGTAEKAVADAEVRGRGVHILGQFAAPEQAASELAGRGAVFGGSLSDIPSGDIVVFAAHGVPPQVRDEAAARGLEIIDATCPFVALAQAHARRLADRGDHLVLIGQPGHPAAAAIAGHAGGSATVVATPAGTAALRAGDARRISYLLQPGLPVEDSAPVATALRSRFPAVRGPHPDGFCYAATDRADSIRAIASGADLVLILGAPESADVRQLSVLARDCGARAQAIAHTGEITPAMLTGTASLGIAESTSARTGLAAEMTAALAGLGPLSVVRRQVSTTVDGQPAVLAPVGG
ncbi:MAG TPA: 4-hydroxy-3-methylbut-2-enyl diphosphate reductase [Streptosporangiaceae bacterium]|nr:4-hydroxy-3-methylbut-2-enyl diphosphate reductase [Streptosporangiaceae bacterium]